MRLSSIKGASTKGFASKDRSWFSICAKLRERIVGQFKNNVSQSKIANNVGLSSSTVHTIVKRFRESGENLGHKGYGQKLLLNHWTLRRYGLRNRHATMMDIATWAWEYLRVLESGNSLPRNTVRRYIKKYNLNLYYARRKHWDFFCAKMTQFKTNFLISCLDILLHWTSKI